MHTIAQHSCRKTCQPHTRCTQQSPWRPCVFQGRKLGRARRQGPRIRRCIGSRSARRSPSVRACLRGSLSRLLTLGWACTVPPRTMRTVRPPALWTQRHSSESKTGRRCCLAGRSIPRDMSHSWQDQRRLCSFPMRIACKRPRWAQCSLRCTDTSLRTRCRWERKPCPHRQHMCSSTLPRRRPSRCSQRKECSLRCRRSPCTCRRRT